MSCPSLLPVQSSSAYLKLGANVQSSGSQSIGNNPPLGDKPGPFPLKTVLAVPLVLQRVWHHRHLGASVLTCGLRWGPEGLGGPQTPLQASSMLLKAPRHMESNFRTFSSTWEARRGGCRSPRLFWTPAQPTSKCWSPQVPAVLWSLLRHWGTLPAPGPAPASTQCGPNVQVGTASSDYFPPHGERLTTIFCRFITRFNVPYRIIERPTHLDQYHLQL